MVFGYPGIWPLTQVIAMALFIPFQPAAAEYPNHLATPEPERIRLPSAPWLLLMLVVLCLIPRVVMALRIPSVCPDGVLYIDLAKAIEAGDLRSGFGHMSLNTYPVILAGLHQLGLDWELGAALWGVVISSLVVLPLWGWARRQFDDRVALVACLLYAVNPKMIEWSPEVMRDPTFWFLFVLAIYWLWRAVTEVHHGYFIAAGAAVLLASLTRIEGLFLLIPVVLWTLWRYLALKQGRRKLLVGVTLCVALIPALILLVNVIWFCGRTGWTAVRLDPVARVLPWLQTMLGHAVIVTGDDAEKPLSFGRMIWVFIPTMTRGLSPAFALLMLGGIWGWRRVWARRDNQPLFLVSVVIMCGIWVQLWYDKNICPRYALPIVLMGSVFAALGFLGFVDRLLRILRWLHWGEVRQEVLAATAAIVIVVISLADAMTSNTKYFETRRMAADMGGWMQREFADRPTLVGPVGITPIVSYYASSTPYQMFRWEAGDAAILNLIEQSKPGVVMLRPTKQLTPDRCDALIDRLKEAGLEPLDRSALPPTCDLSVLVRPTKTLQVGQGPARVY